MCLASFSMQGVWLHLLFTILCFSADQAIETMYYFFTQNQIQIRTRSSAITDKLRDAGL